MVLPALALLFVQDKTETKGKSYAQILAMGRPRWHRFFVGADEGVTAAESGAENVYGDALAWRTDRLKRPGMARLRKVLQDTKNDAVAVGSAISGGGTMWNMIAASLYADAEETLYAVLTKTGKAPKRVVSDVDRAFARAKARLDKAEFFSASDRIQGNRSLVDLRHDLDSIVAEARKQPRHGSDALLDFGVRMAEATDTGE